MTCRGWEGVVGEAEPLWTMLLNCGSVFEEAWLCGTSGQAGGRKRVCDRSKTTFPSILPAPELPCPKAWAWFIQPFASSNLDAEDMWSRSVWRLLQSESCGGRQVSTPCGRFSRALRRGEKRRVSPMSECIPETVLATGRRGCHALLPNPLLALETLLPVLPRSG